ncbi:MAG: hypothetical protein K5829_04435 [Treponema sp.]|nr:hypothetical protein [Treponema sp.]
MLQFYFLSILFNLVTGLILVNKLDEKSEEKELILVDENGNVVDSDKEEKKAAPAKVSKKKIIQEEIRNTSLFESKTFRLVLGILTGLTGILKFVSVIKTDIPVIGDLLPAVIGIAGSFCLLLEYYLKTATIEVKLPEFLNNVFIKNSNVIGFLSIVIAVIHFIFPTVLFL